MTIESRQALRSEAQSARSTTLRRAVGIGLGALCVAASAQVTVPVAISPVPMTLQPLAVLAVGGLLGGPRGLAALVTYLALGVAGLPVFAGGSGGIVHLLGPTGGYLLAFPLAAGLVGAVVGQRPGVLRVLGACALGMVVIHVGGVAQLAFLTGDPERAYRLGFVPFLTGDLLKVGIAALVILGAGPAVRARL
jgi:biotin transport system substrate-specific component